MLTKTQLRIMEVFVSQIRERFSIKHVAELLHKHYPLVHRSAKGLIKEGILVKDRQNYLSLNYKENLGLLAYIEYSRARSFLQKRANGIIALFAKDALNGLKDDFFVLLIFGSAAEQKKQPGDVDVLLVVNGFDKVNSSEKTLYNIAEKFSLKFDINVISKESVYEMLSKRDELNVVNETLNKHIILFGSENYYRMLKNARR